MEKLDFVAYRCVVEKEEKAKRNGEWGLIEEEEGIQEKEEKKKKEGKKQENNEIGDSEIETGSL